MTTPKTLQLLLVKWSDTVTQTKATQWVENVILINSASNAMTQDFKILKLFMRNLNLKYKFYCTTQVHVVHVLQQLLRPHKEFALQSSIFFHVYL